MAKVKEQMMKEQELEFEQELSYQEYLLDNFSEPSGVEIINMAREILRPSTFHEMMWSVFAANNVGYQPTLEG